jgi:hypothetical protein
MRLRVAFAFARLSPALLGIVTLACGAQYGSDPLPQQSPAIAIQVTPTAITLPQGWSTTDTISLTRTNYTGTVQLTVEAVSTGLVATFSSASLPNGSTSTRLTITAEVTAPLASGSVVVRARGSGVLDQVATIAVAVQAPPSVEIRVTPETLSVVQGSVAEETVIITRNNFNFLGPIAPVALLFQALPSGVTQTTYTGFVGASTRVAFNVGRTAAVGASTITVTATAGSRVPTAVATFTLVVKPSS